MTTKHFWCLVVENDKKPVTASSEFEEPSNNKVDYLKLKVKERFSTLLKDVDAPQLDVWQCTDSTIAFDDADPQALEEKVQKIFIENKVVKLKIQDTLVGIRHQETVFVVLPEGERATKKRKLEPNGEVPPWLMNWHSTLWGKAPQRPFSRTVVVTVASYHDLKTKLTEVAPEETDEIMSIKRDFLNTLPIDTTATEINELGELDEDEPADKVDADLTLPMRITYIDLSDLDVCPRIPQLVLYRPEFDELTQKIEEYGKGDKDYANYKFVTGTPGMGKTVYLHLQLVRMLLEGIPFLYQYEDGRVFHLGKSVTPIKYDVPKHLEPTSHILVDFDGKAGPTSPSPAIRGLTKGQIILASSPGPTISGNWSSQKPHLTFVLRNWEAEEFWTALSAESLPPRGNPVDIFSSVFLSPIWFEAEQLRKLIFHFGFNPRFCTESINPQRFNQFKSEARGAVKSVTDLAQLLAFMDRDDPPDQKATNRIFDIVPDDSLLFANAHLRPRSDWAMGLMLTALAKKKKKKSSQKAFHDLIAAAPKASGFFGRFWEDRVHEFFREAPGSLKRYTLRELGNSNRIEWALTVEHHTYFPTAELFPTLQNAVAGEKTTYLQPYSESYPTIDAMVYSKEPIARDVCPLVLLQMATNEHSLKVKGFQLLQRHITRSSKINHLRPSVKSPWAVIFVVPDDKAHAFTGKQTIVGNANDVGIWESKTRQFVLAIPREDIYR
ncbi:hypothetical protein BD410DRAFT_802001 [Rickenella mellea]|uniref:Uncharacterized protein n=1 Tax=Rickenella mellea TaxID=50990 RepID=A0A4Y7QA65_9AGAM|nr:hypothetical protein BD410DRAFT_802001 [Rickenella mellea]